MLNFRLKRKAMHVIAQKPVGREVGCGFVAAKPGMFRALLDTKN
jgi:hypothetical protein